MQPRDLFEDEDEGDHGAPDPNDDADWEHGGGAPSRADPLDPLSDFIKELQGLSTMSGPDISAIIADLPVPDDGDVDLSPFKFRHRAAAAVTADSESEAA
jgi:hypothetical protein